jgi:hypothetical protein
MIIDLFQHAVRLLHAGWVAIWTMRLRRFDGEAAEGRARWLQGLV